MRVTPRQLLTENIHSSALLASLELGLRQTVYPLGFPMELETNSDEVIAAAREGWGDFAPAFDEPPIRLCLGVTDSDASLLTIKSVFAAREHVASLYADADNFVLCDFRQGFAFGRVTRGVSVDHPLLRYRFLMPAAHMLAEQKALAPLHGALVVKNDVGVMLCGESMAGKSTLAYACARAGWSYVSDDGTFLVRSRSDRYAVGDFSNIRLRQDAIQLFPELSDRLAVVRPNGKIALEIRTRELPISVLPGHSIDHVVFLDRGDSLSPSIRPYPGERALEEWKQYAAFGTQEVREEQLHSQRRLLNAGMWMMHYSRLDDAIATLDRLVQAGR